MKEIFFVTGNKNKLKEVRKILGFEIKHTELEIREMQSMSLREIVEDKAKKAFEKIRKPVIVEDTALCIKAWKNFPGPLIRWVMETMGVEEMCGLLGKNRKAMAEACVAYYDGKRMKIFSGTVKGEIAKNPRGRKRFDWDRAFIPKGFERTFAEMTMEEKNRISHRSKAFLRLKEYLKSSRGP